MSYRKYSIFLNFSMLHVVSETFGTIVGKDTLYAYTNM